MTISHLDDEQLSAHLDKEPGADGSGHLDSCPTCGRRLANLAFVASLVGAPVAPPGDAVRNAALATARQAWANEKLVAESPAAVTVVALHSRRRLPRWALPLAAAAAAVLVAVPVLSSFRDSKKDATTTYAADNGAPGGQRVREVAATDGGNLGDQSDPTALGLAIRDALPGAASEAALAAPAPLSPAAGSNDGASPTAPEVAARSTAGATTKGSGKPLANPACATTARTTYGKGLGPLVYAARLVWQGEPAVALGYRLADAGAPGLDYRVLVMATKDCRLLVVQSL